MKINLYDTFSDYKGDLPDISEENCNNENINRIVMQRIKKKTVIRKKSRIAIISIAAALTALSGITAVAYSEGFIHFKNILQRTENNPSISRDLPLVNDNNISSMEQNISESCIIFTGDDNLKISTAGMYCDNNTLMIAAEIISDTEIPENSLIIPYFSKIENGLETPLLNKSGFGMTSQIYKGDTPNTYYTSFYLTEKDIAGCTIKIQLENIISDSTYDEIQSAIIEEQNKWREDFDFENHTVQEWKAYWKANDFDSRTYDFISDYLENCNKILSGSWTAEIKIPENIVDTITAEKDGFKVTADTLSLTLDCTASISEGKFAVPVITMKDDTVVLTAGTNELEYFIDNGICTDTNYEYFASVFSNVYSYKLPHPVENIADITVYIFGYGENGIEAESHNIYKSEDTK